jgi:hypothetical protein
MDITNIRFLRSSIKQVKEKEKDGKNPWS